MAKRSKTTTIREVEVSNINGKRVVRVGGEGYRGELDGEPVVIGSTAFEVETELNRIRFEALSRR